MDVQDEVDSCHWFYGNVVCIYCVPQIYFNDKNDNIHISIYVLYEYYKNIVLHCTE